MRTAPGATLALSGATTPARAARRPAALAAIALARSPGAVAALVLLAGAYTAKCRLGIDVFPGLDVLPDPEVEAAIAAAAGLLFGRL